MLSARDNFIFEFFEAPYGNLSPRVLTVFGSVADKNASGASKTKLGSTALPCVAKRESLCDTNR